MSDSETEQSEENGKETAEGANAARSRRIALCVFGVLILKLLVALVIFSSLKGQHDIMYTCIIVIAFLLGIGLITLRHFLIYELNALVSPDDANNNATTSFSEFVSKYFCCCSDILKKRPKWLYFILRFLSIGLCMPSKYREKLKTCLFSTGFSTTNTSANYDYAPVTIASITNLEHCADNNNFPSNSQTGSRPTTHFNSSPPSYTESVSLSHVTSQCHCAGSSQICTKDGAKPLASEIQALKEYIQYLYAQYGTLRITDVDSANQKVADYKVLEELLIEITKWENEETGNNAYISVTNVKEKLFFIETRLRRLQTTAHVKRQAIFTAGKIHQDLMYSVQLPQPPPYEAPEDSDSKYMM